MFLGIAKVRVYFSNFGILFTPFSLAKHFQIVQLKRTQAGFFRLFSYGLFIITQVFIKLWWVILLFRRELDVTYY